MRRLVLYLVPCSSSGACSLCSLPCFRFPWGFFAFSVTGCLPFCFPGGIGWVSALPSLLFSVLLLLRLACRGSLGSAPCVRVLQLELCLLFGRQCHHPACFPLPWMGQLWTAVSPVSVSFEVCGLGCPLWFVLLFMSLFVLHLLLG